MKAGSQRAFRYLRRDTLVETETAAHVEWLRDCLEPHFRCEPACDGNWCVAFSTDPERFRRVMAQRVHTAHESIPFFTLDSRVVALPRWNPEGAEVTVAFDEEFEVFFTVCPARREVEVLARELRPWTRVALLRVVRELAMEEALLEGGVFLHAAAFERDGVTYVIAGPKNAGKTTLLTHALTCGEARFVANDRVLLLPSRDGYAVRGMPTLVSVRPGTLRYFAQFFDQYSFGPDSACLTREEHEIEKRRLVTRFEDTVILNPRQFTEALGATSSIGGRLGAILFPAISVTAKDVDVGELRPHAARGLLASALFPTLARDGGPTAFGNRPPEASTGRKLLAQVEAESVPLLGCTLGPCAYELGATAWLDQLRRLAGT